jgi:hypothetical protein
MSSQFRTTRPDDAAAVKAFLRSVFGMDASHPVVNPEQMQWKYWQDHPDWEGSRGFVMEREQEIIAHGSIIPLPCLWLDRRLRIVNLIDWAARPDSTGAGMALLKKIAQMVDGVFVAGGSEMTQKILPALGFKESVKAMQFARPIRPLRRLLTGSDRSWRSVARFSRNTMWELKAPAKHLAGWTAQRLNPDKPDGANLPWPHPTAEASAVFERSEQALAYFLKCPAAPADMYQVKKHGAVSGYFVLTRALAQCRIADAWLESDDPSDWAALYQLAVQCGKASTQVAEIATVATTKFAIQALQQTGFHERGQVALRFLLRGGSSPPQDIRYQLIDGDGAYLHDGRESFWA